VSRLFVTQKEINLISDLTKELVKDIVGSKVIFYPISEIKTDVHGLYNESPEKVFDNPIEIECLVNSPEQTTRINLFGPEKLQSLEVYVHYRDMMDRKIEISIGDFLQYGGAFYEITAVDKMRQIYGHAEQIDGYKLICTQAREGQFKAPRVAPFEGPYTDESAVQEEFVQQRGLPIVDDKETGDKRALQETGQLDRPVDGPARVVRTNEGSSFYDEK
jgi:hypothetical protein